MDRPSRRALIKPALERISSCADIVLAAVSSFLAISPAAIPPGPAFTSCRKTSRRDSWESAESRLTASDVLICQYSMKYRITSTRPGNPPKRKCWHHTAMIERAERSPQRVLCVDAPDSALVQLAVHRALVIHAFAPEGTKA